MNEREQIHRDTLIALVCNSIAALGVMLCLVDGVDFTEGLFTGLITAFPLLVLWRRRALVAELGGKRPEQYAGELPADFTHLTLSVDVQRGKVHYSVLAHTRRFTVYAVDYGTLIIAEGKPIA